MTSGGPAARLYRLALRCLWPRALRQVHEAEAIATVQRLSGAARQRGRAALSAYWLREFASLLRTAWMARRLPPALPPDALPPGRTQPMAMLLQDLRYAVRILRRAPGFATVVVITFALGLGANVAIFSLVDGILLKPLPYRDPGQLLFMQHQRLDNPEATSPLSPGTFGDLLAGSTLVRPLAGFWTSQHTIRVRDEAERVLGVASIGSVLEVLGVPAALGRIFTAEEDRPDAPAVVVLSHGAWRRLFDQDPAVIGQSIVVNGQPATVIGVMPDGFHPSSQVELWRPGRLDAEMRQSRTQYFLAAIGRMAPGASREAAAAQLETVMQRVRTEHPQATSELGLRIQPLQERYVGEIRTRLWILMASVLCVLLIACANITNLMLARAADRRREVSLRQAIGAARGRLVSQLLVESLVLTIAGAAAGVLVGQVFLQALVAWLPADTPRLSEAALDLRVLAAAGATAVTAGVLMGLVPALQLSVDVPASALRDGTRAGSARSRFRSALVVAQVALAVVLLAGAGLLLRSFVALQQVQPGFNPQRLLTFAVDVGGPAYEDPARRLALLRDALEQLGALPGVESSAAGSNLPVAGSGTSAWFNLLERPVPAGETPPAVPYRVVTSGYFPTLGIPLTRGRLLRDGDGLEGTPAVVISESMARRFWPETDPLGARIYLGAPDNRLFPEATVVGVVGDVKQAGLDSDSNEAVYGTPELMPWWGSYTFALRTAGDPVSHAASARAIVRRLDPSLPLSAMRTMDDIVEASMGPTRASMFLITIFGLVALALAAIGVFGVLSYAVSQRSRELGIRLALGADASAIRGLVLREGLGEVTAGIALGLLGAFWLTEWMTTLLFNVAPRDPLTYAAVAVLLAAVGAAACYLPARRATRVNPLIVLQGS